MENLIKINEFFSSGSGSGSGNGYGYGNGYGSGSGSGSGYGNGYGYGYGSGSGSGSGDGTGSGNGYGYGNGYGSGSGYGSGNGSGSGYGYGYGYGSGSGSGSGISTFIGDMVYSVDGVPTIIDHVNRNVARGQILKADLSTEPCYVVKNGSLYAHGETLRDAMTALNEKTFDGMPEEERIAAFVAAHDDGKKYPNTDFFEWHHKLTGSCEIGRKAFAEDHCVDMSGEMSVMEFIELTEHDYGGQTIKKLRPYYTAEVKERSGGSR